MKKIRWKFASSGFQARNKALQNFTEEYMNVSSKTYTKDTIGEANDIYDGFVCGSDQVWNPLLSSLDDIYWLKFANSDKCKIAYAPSIGVKEVNSDQSQKIQMNLSSFKAVSCREESGTKLINSIMNHEICKTVLDPTLLLEKNEWDKICHGKKVEGDYIFAYILRGTKGQRQLVEQFAKKYNLKIVTFPYLDCDYIEKYDKVFGDIKIYDASPADFIQLIRDAKYVFTDSFHCSIFSIIYHKVFYIFSKTGKAQNTRLNDLQEKFGIENRMLSGDGSLNEIETLGEIDWCDVDNRLDKLRNESLSFIRRALEV